MAAIFRHYLISTRIVLIVFLLLAVYLQNVFCQQGILFESYVRNSYIPRGFIGTKNPTIEGSLTYPITANNKINLWGISSVLNKYSEIDLTLEHQYKNLTISLIDYYNPSANKTFNYFNLNEYNKAHTLDLILFYRLNRAFPLGLKWSSYLYGYDHDPTTDTRLFSTYIELSYPFTNKQLLFNPYVAFVPWKSWYANRFSVVNCGVKLDTDLLCNESACVPATFNMIYNPQMEQFNLNLILGIQLRNKTHNTYEKSIECCCK